MSQVNNYDIHIYQGETWALTIEIFEDDGDPKNLTGYTVKMEIRDKPGGVLYETLSTGVDASVTVTGISGTIAYSMSKTRTAALTFKKAVYDTYIESAGGTRTPILKGEVLLARRVTE